MSYSKIFVKLILSQKSGDECNNSLYGASQRGRERNRIRSHKEYQQIA